MLFAEPDMDDDEATPGERMASSHEGEAVEKLPPGWMISEQNKRKVYLTPLPRRVKIDCRARLIEFQKQGKFLEMKQEDLVFGLKRKRKSKAFDEPSFSYQSEASATEDTTAVDDKQDEDLDLINKFKRTLGEEDFGSGKGSKGKLDREQRILNETVIKLTKDPSKHLNHKELLESSARKLNDLRLKDSPQQVCPNVAELQSSLKVCKTGEEIAQVVWSSPSIQKRLADLFSSKQSVW